MLYFVSIGPTFVVFRRLSRGCRFQLHTNTACVVCKPPADVGKPCTLEPCAPSPVGNKRFDLYLIAAGFKPLSLQDRAQGLLRNLETLIS